MKISEDHWKSIEGNMENLLDSDLDEYLTEYRLQAPNEPISHYEDGELEAEWLVSAGFPQLTKPFQEGREIQTKDLEPILASLPERHSEAVKQRVRALNRTVRGRTRSRYNRKPDIRDVFRDVDESSTGTRSRSATPDSLDSIPGDESWNSPTLPTFVSIFDTSAQPARPKQKLQRTPSAPLRGSAELFRGTHIRCDIPFYTADGIELLGFQRLGTIPRIRSGSDPSCSLGRQRGNQILSSRSHSNLLSDSSENDLIADSSPKSSSPQNSPSKGNYSSITHIIPSSSSPPETPISFEGMMVQSTNQSNIEWDQLKEPCCDIDDINEHDLKRLQPLFWLELAALFDKHQISLDKRKPFKRKRKEEGNVFGVSLNALIRRDQQVTGEDSTLVPLLLQGIIKELTNRGAKEEGILRIAGNKQKAEILYTELETVFYQKPEKVRVLLSQAGVHDISALLKRWLRELPQPLLAHDLIHLFYQTHAIPTPDQFKALSMICLLLPHENRNTLRALLAFLNYVIERETFNKMTKHNVATIIAPSLFPPRFVHPVDKNNIEAQVKMAANCCYLTKVLITQGDKLFMVPKRLIDQSRSSKTGQGKRHVVRKTKDVETPSEVCVINPNHVHRLIV